mgnify:CR=1 FL=1
MKTLGIHVANGQIVDLYSDVPDLRCVLIDDDAPDDEEPDDRIG